MPKMQLKENVDYYLENGLYVFTEAYHLKRGYCCGSKCRHCPYPKEIQAQTVQLRLEGHPIQSREAFVARFGPLLVKP
ncbi:DUF5522 domain-containing protein [Meiothermus sp.]|uniref:DUF5522 domain-containing protein n=1 Tax=Meiothermus sp. TaxID=1955249 RepID=UPI0021DD31B8|nr:DUF5522 domain-containing protein [Meiothermus sp.]GIW33983.1 MAG: hypothetical protein KatS3mg072_1316 [Meiothermus sp.]